MRIHRLLAILMLLESKGKIKAGELAESLETSVRTIQRDMNILGESGVPIYAETGPQGGYSLMEGYSFDSETFFHDEVINLYLTGIGFRIRDHSDTTINLKNALLKLEKTIPSPFSKEIKKIKDRFYFDPDPWWHYIQKISHFELLRKSVLKSLELEIEYEKEDGEVTIRIIHPYGLVEKYLTWYCAAFCLKRNQMRIFHALRIKKATETGRTFNIPDTFSLQDYWIKEQTKFYHLITKKENLPDS